MPLVRCVVDWCSSTTRTEKLFKLPKNDSLRAIWLRYLVPLNPRLKTQTKKQLVQRGVCQKHFEKKYIVNNQRLQNGCPTLFTEEEISSGQPFTPVFFQAKRDRERSLADHNYFNNKQGYTDHTYCRYSDDDDETTENNIYPDDEPTPDKMEDAEHEDRPEDNEPTEVNEPTKDNELTEDLEDIEIIDYPPIPSPDQAAHPNINSPQHNALQHFINNFAKSIQNEINKPPPEDNKLASKFEDLLEAYNFSSNIIETNKEFKFYEDADLCHAEKAYALITFCLLKQKKLLENNIREFLEWAAKATLSYGSVEEKILETFVNGEWMHESSNILKEICEARLQNTKLRKIRIVNQVLGRKKQELLSKIGYSTKHLFNEDALSSVSSYFPIFHKASKVSKITQTISPKRSNKAVQVKSDRAKDAEKCVHVGTNEMDDMSTGHILKDASFQTLDDKSPLQEVSENAENSEANRRQKIRYVVKIKKRHHPDENTMHSSNQESIEISDQAGPRGTDFAPQHVPSEFDCIENSPVGGPLVLKKKKQDVPIPDSTTPVLWDDCSKGGTNEMEAKKVHTKLKKKPVVRKRSSFRKKLGVTTPEETKGSQPSPASTVQNISDSYKPEKSTNIGGCKDISNDPQAGSVPPSSMFNSTQVSNEGICLPNMEVSSPVPDNDALKSSGIHKLVKEAQNPIDMKANTANSLSSVTFSLTYDNVLKWT